MPNEDQMKTFARQIIDLVYRDLNKDSALCVSFFMSCLCYSFFPIKIGYDCVGVVNWINPVNFLPFVRPKVTARILIQESIIPWTRSVDHIFTDIFLFSIFLFVCVCAGDFSASHIYIHLFRIFRKTYVSSAVARGGAGGARAPPVFFLKSTSKVGKFPIPLPNATISNILIVKARMLGKHFVSHMSVTGVTRM